SQKGLGGFQASGVKTVCIVLLSLDSSSGLYYKYCVESYATHTRRNLACGHALFAVSPVASSRELLHAQQCSSLRAAKAPYFSTDVP
ncbi:MAG TPA: hypothetical protein VEY06_11985, partial [Flavisolibacter sp.]|nr:hypothetical protein [Flavisolibacter sp.]